MVKLINKKIKGSTIIEVLVAMVIIMVVFAIAIRIYANVTTSGVAYRKIQAQQELLILAKQIQNRGFVDEERLQKDSIDYVFKTDTSILKGYGKLAIQAYQQHKLLAKVNCYYLVKEQRFED